MKQRKRTRWGNFTWISPAPLLASINDQIVKGLNDLVNGLRMRWIASVRPRDCGGNGFVIKDFATLEDFSFLVLGDPGEQDASQYAVVAPLLAKGTGTSFMVICSDVIYPAGDINEYIDGFYLPYRAYREPIFALPGNHDWYDGLNGFMFHFCGAEPLPPTAYRSGSYSWRERLARALWRKPSPPDMPAILHERDLFVEGEWKPAQPGPYHAIETDNLLIVSIDTGITGKLDAEQGEWLRKISCDDRAKILLTGKPIYVDGEYHPGEIDWAETEEHPDTVDDIVRDPDHRYVAVIGGDIHNYQRYSVALREEQGGCDDGAHKSLRQPIEYIVAGGGGAYLSATHSVGRVDLIPSIEKHPVEPIVEDENFWCYPLRGDSLARFTRRFAPGLGVTLFVAILAILGVLFVFFVPFDGFDQTIGGHDRFKAWHAIYLTPATIVAAIAILFLASKISNALPRGYRTLSATTLTIAMGAALVLVLNITDWPEAWSDLVRMMFASLIAASAPVVALVSYYLLRDFLAPSVRVGIALAVPIGLGTAALSNNVDLPVEGATLTATALLALWLAVFAVARLRNPDGPPDEHKFRVRLAGVLPPVLAAAGLIVLLYSIRDTNFLPAAVLAALAALVVVIAAGLLAIGWRGLLAAPWILSGRIDPDKASRWIADRIETDPVREDARNAKLDLKTRALASLTYRTWPFNLVMSELAEATSPPFFKNFLRLDVTPSKVTVTAYGVTGWREDETAPTKEDVVEVPLPPRETRE